MYIERKQYPLGNGQHAASYEITDDNGHAVQLTTGEVWDVLIWLDQRRGELFHDLHPEPALDPATMLDQEREEREFSRMKLDDAPPDEP